MKDNEGIISWLEHLRVLMPPTNIVLVGAGAGGSWVQLMHDWAQPRATLIEADLQQFERLARTVTRNEDNVWRLVNSVVAGQTGLAPFFSASNPAESGLIDPKELRSLWPNIYTTERQERQTQTLAQIRETGKQDESKDNWLVIDCLPAVQLIEGRGSLEGLDVVVARVLFESEDVFKPLPVLASLAELASLLQEGGFRQIAVEQGRHPVIGYALFVRDADTVAERLARDHAQQLEQAKKEKDEQGRLAQERQTKIDQLIDARAAAEKQAQEYVQQLEQAKKAKDEQAKLAQERQTKIDQLIDARAAAEKQAQEYAQQLEQAKNEQAKLAQERQTKIDQLIDARAAAEKQAQEYVQRLEQAKNEQAKLAQERQTEIDQLIDARAAAEKQAQEYAQQLEQAKKAKDEQTRLAQERQSEIDQLIDARAVAEKQAQEYVQQLEQAKNEQARLAQREKFGSDANIDDFIRDIAPYFQGRAVTYVDVGAYIGEVLLKIEASKTIRVREAHLFEPNPESYEKLTQNLAKRSFKNLMTYNHAIGFNRKNLILNAAGSMTKTVTEHSHIKSSAKRFKTESRSLDSIRNNFTDQHIDLLKIDVEGDELDVLQNSTFLLKNNKIDIIYIEVGFNKDGIQQTYFASIDRIMQRFGYRVFGIYEQMNEWISDSPLLRRCNFAYMSKVFAGSNPRSAYQKISELERKLSDLKEPAD